jgi:hypothetical protein
MPLHDPGRDGAIAEDETRSFFEALVRLAERPPSLHLAGLSDPFEQEQLGAAAARLVPAKARTKDACVVEDEQRGREQGRQISDAAMRKVGRPAPHHQKARSIAIRERLLGDLRFRERVVEQFEEPAHRHA